MPGVTPHCVFALFCMYMCSYRGQFSNGTMHGYGKFEYYGGGDSGGGDGDGGNGGNSSQGDM